MPGKFYAPLTVALIEEGNLEKDLQEEFAAQMREHVAFVKKYGEDADKSTSELVLKIKLKYDGEDGFSVKSTVDHKCPGRLPHVTRARLDVTEDGEEVIVVRRAGSDHNEPRQAKLATVDGRAIVDGEAVEAPAVKTLGK